MWVLIVIFAIGTGGYTRGPAVNFQEFNSKERCEEALKIIQKGTSEKDFFNNEIIKIDGICIKK